MVMDDKEFWEREARMMAHKADRHEFRMHMINQFLEGNMPFKTTPEDIDHMFTYHAPKEDQIPKYNEIREEARKFAQTILRLTPGCPDQTVAIRHVREAVMNANAAIALEK